MTRIRRLDHIAILVRSTEEALRDFQVRFALDVVHVEELETPHVRLTYLDCGNAYLQLVEPLDEDSELASSLRDHGEGMHHICFGVDDVAADAAAMGPKGAPAPRLGRGRGRVSAFVAGPPCHGVRLECTQFVLQEDVVGTPGWLAGGHT